MARLSLIQLLFLFACSMGDAPTAISYEKNGPLKHIVLLELKENCSEQDIERVVQALYSLQEIEEVIDLEVSQALDTGDDRLLSGYDIILYTELGSEADLKKYSKDEFHLSVREDLKPYLATKPKVIDAFEYKE